MKIRKTKEAFKWIIKILLKQKITFEVRGGFAARIYGSKRKLADIDIQVKNAKLKDIFLEIKDYIIFGPQIYKDKNWNLLLLTLNYKGQNIDISGLGSVRIFNKATRKWVYLTFNPLKSVQKKVYGIKTPVIPIKNLINYKRKLSRKVDLWDVDKLSKK